MRKDAEEKVMEPIIGRQTDDLPDQVTSPSDKGKVQGQGTT